MNVDHIKKIAQRIYKVGKKKIKLNAKLSDLKTSVTRADIRKDVEEGKIKIINDKKVIKHKKVTLVKNTKKDIRHNRLFQLRSLRASFKQYKLELINLTPNLGAELKKTRLKLLREVYNGIKLNKINNKANLDKRINAIKRLNDHL